MNVLARVAAVVALLAAPGAALPDPWGPAGRSRVTGNGSLLFPFEERVLRMRGDCAARVSAIRSVGLLVTSVKVPEATTGGVVEHPEWSAAGRDNLAASVEAALSARGVAVKRLGLPADERSADAWRQVSLLHDAVVTAIMYATYEQGFPAKLATFEYGLGDLTPLLAEQGVDALVFASAENRIPSSGAQLLGIGGVRSVYKVAVQLSVVDRTGAVVWFDLFLSGRSYDLRDANDSDRLLRRALADLPGGKP